MIRTRNGSVFFCDESGSTGVDLWSDEQPFYVTGGVMLAPDGVDRVEAYVASLLDEKKWQELKGKNLGKDPVAMVGILDKVEELGGEFFFVVSEKKYSIPRPISKTKPPAASA